ncbi:MAG: hypothetical protein Q4C91_09960 [Eubacteriales bacterium]|nr:hypothetical protein [Eubacteriales bacterium]
MTKGRNKGLKKLITSAATAMMITLSISTTAFASPVFYTSEEGTGIEVSNSVEGVQTRATIQGDKVSVSGGTLWATWKDGVSFKANYKHSSKTHRCSATNDHGTVKRSGWVPAGTTAVSPWLDQTLSNNKVWAATK